MSFFSASRWGFLSKQSYTPENRRQAKSSNPRVRPKGANGIEPVVTVLELREMIGCFVADIAVTAGGVAVAQRTRDPFADASVVDFSVSGGSSSGTSPTAIDRGGWQGAVPPTSTRGGSLPGGGEVGPGESLLGELDASSTQSPLAANDIGDATMPVLGDALSDVTPRPHGEIRKLQLAPPASAVGASTTFVADTGTPASHGGSDIEIPVLDQPASFTVPIPNAPPLPPPAQPSSNGEHASSTSTGPASSELGASDSPSTEGWSSPPASSEAAPAYSGEPAGVSPRMDAVDPGGPGSESSSSGAAASSAVQNGGEPFVIPPGQNCSGGGPPGQSGGLGQTGGGVGQSGGSVGQSGGGPPIAPPGQCSSSSVPDPLYVLNWHEQLVMFPNVIEFDQPADYVELRAQVYGATVQSYSWDTSQASRDGCVTGASTYKLQFRWTGYAPVETTEQITITATMTDQTTQQQTLTFKLAAGNAASCPGMGQSFPTTTWPAVLAPDKPLEAQDLVASDSATRPYAISSESGVLYVGHGLPAYNPGVPALGLTHSSIAADRQPIFVGRYELDPSAAVPNTVSARLQFNGTWGSSKYYDTSPSTTKFNPGDIIQISLQADAGSLATGRYDYTFETTANYSGSSTTTSSSGSVTIVNEESSVFGEGWTLAEGSGFGVQGSGLMNLFNRLHVVTGGVILNQGAGNSLWFAGSGPYTTPAGDFSTLVKNGDNTYTRTLKDGTKQNFDSSGYQTSLVDLNSNRLTFTYDGSNNLSTITDPNNLVTTFSYSGSCGASGKVCTITDPANRVTSFSYTGSGRLEKITDPDAAVFTFTYDSSSGRINTMVDPRTNTTTFSYDFAGRVDTVTRPDSTTESFTALQLQSLCDSGQCTSGQPGTPLISAEAVADYTDPRSNAWDGRLDWYGFGVTTQLTDPLGQTTPAGHMTVLHRNSNGSITQATDRLDRNIGYTLDSKANVTKITFPGVTQQSTTTYATQQFEYNSFSEVTKTTDELSRVTTLTYDASGNLTQIKQADPDGGGPLTSPITTMTYDSQGRMTTLVDARNYTSTFAYDSRDRLTNVTHPDNTIVTLAYDGASNLTARTDERGNTTTMTYDGMGRMLTSQNALSNVTSLSYDAAGNLTTVTQPDPDGAGSLTSPVTTLTYDSMNRVRTSVDSTNATTTFSYDNASNLVAVTDPLSRTTTLTYNELGYQTSTKTPLGNITTLTYDAEGQLTGVRDPLNRLTTFTWNNRGWMATTTDASGSITTLTYDAVGNRTGSQDSGGSVGNTYDALNRVTQTNDQLNNKTTLTYDAVSNRTSVNDPLSHITTFVYDSRNRQIAITDALSNTTSFTYDGVGNLTVVTDPLSRLTTFAYDAANRRTSITQPDPDGGGSLTSPITTFAYDNLDRMTSLTDPVNNVTSWTYSAIDQVLTEIDPLSKTTTYTYDAAEQLTRMVDRKSQRRDFAYDSDGRRTQEYWCPAGSGAATGCGTSTPTRIFTYTYDAVSQLTEVNETDSRYTFTYDNMGRVTGVASLGSNMPSVTLTNTYDTIGRRTAVADNLSTSGKISFTYDAANRPTNVKMTVGGTVGPTVDLGYDAASRLTGITRKANSTTFDKVTTTFTYDNADRMTAITHTYIPMMGSSTTLATYTYAYNGTSELTGETNKDGTLTYTYDNTSQITGVDASGGTCGATGCDETFSYDTNGNRTMTGYTTGTGNRLTSDGTHNYTFDDNGNTLTKTRISDSQKTEFTWDYRNRLTQVVVKDSSNNILQQSDYTYDAFDRRIIKSFDDDGPGPHSATVTKTLYDGASFAANPYADFNSSNTLTMRYLYGPAVDFILARRDASGTAAWYLADHLGTVRDLANTSGTVLDHISYSAYGRVTAESNPSNGDRFKYTAREYVSEISQYHYRARMYDAAIGRFLSNDPIGLQATDANLYRYVENAPTGAVDPLGLLCQRVPEDDLLDGRCGRAKGFPRNDGIRAGAGDPAAAAAAAARKIAAEVAKKAAEAAAARGLGKFGGMTAEKVISKFKQGRIMKEFPRQYLKKSVEEIEKDAAKGEEYARKARKLLTDGEYDK